jgi:type IV secretion system protein VirD4
VRLTRAVHTAIFAPTGAGKGVACVIPFLLACRDSLVCTDFKGELAILTAEHRRRMKQQIVLLDPWHLVAKQPDTFNPLQFIHKDSPHALDDIRDLAEALVVATGKETDPHWNESGKIVLAGAIAAVVQFADDDDRSLQTVRNVIANPEKMAQVCKLNQGSDAWDGMLARIGYQMSHYKDKELSSVMTTCNRHLSFLDTPAVAASTRTSTFDPAQLRKGKMTVYLVLPLEHARAQAGLLRMWVASMLRAITRGGLEQ